MNNYVNYLKEIQDREKVGLHPKPIDGAELLREIIGQIKDPANPHREDSIKYFIYNTLPGTTDAAAVKAEFLKEVILGDSVVSEISVSSAFEQLSHMKGGPSVKVLIDLALGDEISIAQAAAKVLKTQVFLYESDTERLAKAFHDGSEIARDVIESYAWGLDTYTKNNIFYCLPGDDIELR